jgi:V-type H+-transporting ATPase subunit E
MVKQEQQTIDAQYEKKLKGAEIAQKIAQSNLTNKSRLKLLHRREQHIQELFTQTRSQLGTLISNEGQYVQFLEGVIIQGMLNIMETSVIVHSRPKDVSLAQQARDSASRRYNEMSGKTVKVEVQGSLNDDAAGGVILISGSKRITLDNTIEERLKLLEEKVPIPVCFFCHSY